VALVDIDLPDTTGFEVGRELRRRYPDMVLVSTTGFGDAATRERIAEAGFDHHLVKPLDFDEVLEILVAAAS
jgi:DNA-binding response OmpR family regulator